MNLIFAHKKNDNRILCYIICRTTIIATKQITVINVFLAKNAFVVIYAKNATNVAIVKNVLIAKNASSVKNALVVTTVMAAQIAWVA
jgi:hypothetical protein